MRPFMPGIRCEHGRTMFQFCDECLIAVLDVQARMGIRDEPEPSREVAAWEIE